MKRTQVFISYSHRDQEMLERLEVHLRPLERAGTVEVWNDTRIRPGSRWREEIRNAIDSARVAVLLVSADFLASDFIAENELPPLLAAAESEGLLVLSVILKPCRFERTEALAPFQTLNPPTRPLISLDEAGREAVWDRLVSEIERALTVGPGGNPPPDDSGSPSARSRPPEPSGTGPRRIRSDRSEGRASAGVGGGSGVLALECMAELVGHEDTVWSATFSGDGRSVLTASSDGTARLWNLRSGLAAVLQGHSKTVWGARFSPGGYRVLTWGRDGTAREWLFFSGVQSALYAPPGAAHVYTAAYSPDGALVATGDSEHRACLWRSHRTGENVGLDGAAEPEREGRGPGGPAGIPAYLWNLPKPGLGRRPLLELSGHASGVMTTGFDPKGRLLLTAGDPTPRVWDAASGRLVTELRGHTDDARATFSPAGDRILTMSWDATVRVWETLTGRCLATLRGHTGWVMKGRFDPDGTLAVTAGGDGTAFVWDTRRGRLAHRLTGHAGAVNSVEFSPDGRSILTGSQKDNLARVWDGRSGRLVAELVGHTGGVQAARFSHDGEHIVTASDDHTARVWRFPTAGRPG